MRLRVDVDREKDRCSAILYYDDKVLGIEKSRSKALEDDLRARVTRAEKARLVAEEVARNPPWYRTVWLGAAVGSLVTTAVITAALVASSPSK